MYYAFNICNPSQLTINCQFIEVKHRVFDDLKTWRVIEVSRRKQLRIALLQARLRALVIHQRWQDRKFYAAEGLGNHREAYSARWNARGVFEQA
jgi:hypothetical protein